MIVNVLVLVVLLFGYSESNTDENNASSKWRKFPKVVTLYRLSADNEILPFCSGVVIDKKTLLTAAYCVADSDGELNITNVYVLYEGSDIGDIVTQRVTLGAIHPRYYHHKLFYNIALLSINGSFPDNINQVKIAKEDLLMEGIISDCKAIASDIRNLTNLQYFKINEETNEDRETRDKYNCNGRCYQKKIPMITVHFYRCKKEQSEYNYSMATDGSQFCASTEYIEDLERLAGAPVMCSGYLYGIFNGKIFNITNLNVIARVSFFKHWIKVAGRYLRKQVTSSTKSIRNHTMPALDVPQVVALFKFSNGRELKPFCGGAIINRRTVLTAAHCLVDIQRNITVGEIFIMSGYKEFRFNRVDKHSGVVIHPGFNWVSRSNNIALVRILGEFHPDISPMALPYYDEDKWNINHFTTCKVYGWGLKDFKYNYTSNTSFSITMDESDCTNQCALQMTSFKLLSFYRCKRIFELGDQFKVMQSLFCTFGGISDTCRAESGYMVFCEGKMYGIISDGLFCGNSHRPILNTKIGYYNQWIIETMNNLEKSK